MMAFLHTAYVHSHRGLEQRMSCIIASAAAHLQTCTQSARCKAITEGWHACQEYDTGRNTVTLTGRLPNSDKQHTQAQFYTQQLP